MSVPFDIIAIAGSAPAMAAAAATALKTWIRARKDTHISVEIKREDGAKIVLEYAGRNVDADLIQRILEGKAKEEVSELEESSQTQENETGEGEETTEG